ncbi:Pentatricopeptide repeat-containing protein [Zostera marina]|uniref:Pentatricopeptide repeat-containing protein n=1 Tax=Zostera marina TaxID=29655 RepID=A0A0K9NKY7_ZOSMR|nr:Pentatricopeptide repeat-containing protein [Zostera marina]
MSPVCSHALCQIQRLLKTQISFDPGYRLVVIFDSIVHAHIQSRNTRSALLYLHRTTHFGLRINPSTVHALLHAFLDSKSVDENDKNTLLVFQHVVVSNKLHLDSTGFGLIVREFFVAGEIGMANVLLTQLGRSGNLLPNCSMYTCWISECWKYGYLDEARRLFDEMGEWVDAGPNEVTYTVMMNGYLMNGKNDQVFQMYAKMKQNGVLPNVYTYNTLISLHCKNADLVSAFKVFDEMCSEGLACNVIIYNTLIHGLCKFSKLTEAMNLLKKMNDSGIVPTPATFNILIDGLCKDRSVDKAKRVLHRMKKSGCSPNAITYNSLIAGLCRTGRLAETVELYKEMKERDVPPTKFTHATIIHAFTKANDMQKAIRVYGWMKESGLEMDAHIYGTLIHGFCAQGNMKDAWKLFRSIKPNGVIYDTIIYGYCKEGNSYRSMILIREMVKNKMVPNIASFSLTIRLLCKIGKWEEAQSLLNQASALGLHLEESIITDVSNCQPETDQKYTYTSLPGLDPDSIRVVLDPT